MAHARGGESRLDQAHAIVEGKIQPQHARPATVTGSRQGVSELIIHGAFQTLDLSPFCYEPRNESFLEEAVN